ncbi:MAG: hypothetical protein AAFV98_04050 [Chloroflexota bacterium]
MTRPYRSGRHHPKVLTLLWYAVGLLIAFGLRLLLYDVHGLDGDDGFTLRLIQLPFADLWNGLVALDIDIHPPLYYVLLHGWMQVMGEGLLALRGFGLMVDMLAGALIVRGALHMGDKRVGYTALLLWATAPLLLFSTMLLRMYPLLAFWSAMGMVSLSAFVRGRTLTLVGLCIATLGALYTHLFGLILLAGWGVALFVAWLVGQITWRRLMLSGISLAGMLALYAPWLALRFSDLGNGSVAGQSPALVADTIHVPGQVLLTAWLGNTDFVAPVTGLVAVLVFLGMVGLIVRNASREKWVLLALVGALYGALIAATIANFFRPRYLTILLPPMLVFVSVALGSVRWRAVYGVLIVALLSVNAIGIAQNLDPTRSEDFRAAAHFLEARASDDDLILIVPAWGQDAFDYHYEGGAELVGALSGVGEDTPLDEVIMPLLDDYEIIWLISYQPTVSDPQNLLLNWFGQRAVTVTQVFPAGMSVTGLDREVIYDALPADATPLEAQFSDLVAVRGVQLPVTTSSATDRRLHPPSAWLPVTFYVEALNPSAMPDTLNFRLRLTDTGGQTWGLALERSRDTLRFFPPSVWEQGDIYEVHLDVNLNPATPAGDYWLELMIFEGDGALAVSGVDGDVEANRVLLGRVTIE